MASIPDSLSTTVSATSQTWVLEQKLHEINERYKRLLRALAFKGNLINESIQKHQDYVQKIEAFLPWLAEAERQLAREIQEQMPSDPKKLYKRIEIIKVFRTKNYIILYLNLGLKKSKKPVNLKTMFCHLTLVFSPSLHSFTEKCVGLVVYRLLVEQ